MEMEKEKELADYAIQSVRKSKKQVEADLAM